MVILKCHQPITKDQSMTKEEILSEIASLEELFKDLQAEHNNVEHMLSLIPSFDSSKADEYASHLRALQVNLDKKMANYQHRCDILEEEVRKLEAAAA